MAGPQGDNQSVRIIQPSGEFRRPLAKSDTFFPLRPVQLNSQPGENLRAHRAVRLAQQFQRLREQRHQTAVGGAGVANRPACGDHGAGKEFDLPELPGEIGGLQTRFASLGNVAGLGLA